MVFSMIMECANQFGLSVIRKLKNAFSLAISLKRTSFSLSITLLISIAFVIRPFVSIAEIDQEMVWEQCTSSSEVRSAFNAIPKSDFQDQLEFLNSTLANKRSSYNPLCSLPLMLKRGEALVGLGELPKALGQLEELAGICNTPELAVLRALTLRRLVWINRELAQYSTAWVLALRCEKILTKQLAQHPSLMEEYVKLMHTMGAIHLSLLAPKKALHYFEKAKVAAAGYYCPGEVPTLCNSWVLQTIRLDEGQAYGKIGDRKREMETYQVFLAKNRLDDATQAKRITILRMRYNFLKVQIELGATEKLEEEIGFLYEIAHNENLHLLEVNVAIEGARLYFQTGRSENGIHFLQKAKLLADRHDFKMENKTINTLYGRYYEKKGLLDSAIYHRSKADEIASLLLIDQQSKQKDYLTYASNISSTEAVVAPKNNLASLSNIVGLCTLLSLILFFSVYTFFKMRSMSLPAEETGAPIKSAEAASIIPNKESNLVRKPPIDDEKAVEIYQAVLSYLEEEKKFLDPNCNLLKLSEELEINRFYLSYSINNIGKCNFNNLVNTYRVHEAEKLLDTNFNKDFTIDALSAQVGFQSRSTFFRAFKRVTGKTPTHHQI